MRWALAIVTATAVLVGALAIGQALVSWRATRDATGGPALAGNTSAPTAPPTLPANATPSPAPLTATVSRAEAIALVRSLSWIVRLDRIEAKLVTWAEFEPVGMGVDMTGGPSHGGGLPIEHVWAIAVAGDIYPDGAPIRPLLHYTWSVWGINAARLQVTTLKLGDSGAWPPGYDALPDHVAVAPPPPTPTPVPLVFDQVFDGRVSAARVHDIAAGDGASREVWSIVATDGDPSAAFGRVLRRSVDGGRTWMSVSGVAVPSSVAASGGVVLVSALGAPLDDGKGTSSGGGLFLSKDRGATWTRVSSEGIRLVRAFEYAGRRVFLAERSWSMGGAAPGPSRILASVDGERWRDIGETPGPASFALLDVPVVTFSKNAPGDGFYRVEGKDLASLTLEAVKGSAQAGAGSLITGPRGELWHLDRSSKTPARFSTDTGRTWMNGSDGLAGRIAGLFVLRGRIYALGDGGYTWDGTQWTAVSMLVGKGQGVFQVGDVVFVQDLPGALWRSR